MTPNHATAATMGPTAAGLRTSDYSGVNLTREEHQEYHWCSKTQSEQPNRLNFLWLVKRLNRAWTTKNR